MNIGPLALFQRMNSNGSPTDGFVIASLHWASSITWRWGLWWNRHYGKPRAWWLGNRRHRRIGFSLPIVGTIAFQSQQNMPRVRRVPHLKQQKENDS